MPKVTSVEPQKSSIRRSAYGRKKERFNVFLDGKFAFGAQVETILKYKIKSDEVFTNEEINKIVKKEELSKLFDATLKFLSFRPRSQKEVENYLINKISKKENIKYSQAKESDLIVDIVKKLRKYKYLNDIEFSKWWIDSRAKSRPRGKIILKLELIQKGIKREIIDELLSGIKDQKSLALKAIEKKLTRWQKLPAQELKKKIYSYLSIRGFDFDTIKDVVAQIEKKS